MKKSWFVVLFIAGVALSSAGCLTSLHPWFTEKDLVFEPALVGTWQDAAEADVTWTFERQNDTTYTLIDTRNENEPRRDQKATDKKMVSTRLTARLMRMGDARFLDISAGDDWTDSSWLQLLLVNSHGLAKVSLDGDTLRVAFLDTDRLEGMLRDKRVVLSHDVVDASGGADDPPTRVNSQSRRVLLTATTPELQAFLATYARDAAAFGDRSQMRRQRPAK
jgi:hypothetical protein